MTAVLAVLVVWNPNAMFFPLTGMATSLSLSALSDDIGALMSRYEASLTHWESTIILRPLEPAMVTDKHAVRITIEALFSMASQDVEAFRRELEDLVHKHTSRLKLRAKVNFPTDGPSAPIIGRLIPGSGMTARAAEQIINDVLWEVWLTALDNYAAPTWSVPTWSFDGEIAEIEIALEVEASRALAIKMELEKRVNFLLAPLPDWKFIALASISAPQNL